MDDYRIGDYVRLNTTVIQKVKDEKFDKTSLYKIKSILDGKVMLDGCSPAFSTNDLLPVPINRIEDKGLCWSPALAASVMPSDTPISVSKNYHGYYMDTLKMNDVSLYNKIIAFGCQYVHEVQHVLEDSDEDVNALKYQQKMY